MLRVSLQTDGWNALTPMLARKKCFVMYAYPIHHSTKVTISRANRSGSSVVLFSEWFLFFSYFCSFNLEVQNMNNRSLTVKPIQKMKMVKASCSM